MCLRSGATTVFAQNCTSPVRTVTVHLHDSWSWELWCALRCGQLSCVFETNGLTSRFDIRKEHNLGMRRSYDLSLFCAATACVRCQKTGCCGTAVFKVRCFLIILLRSGCSHEQTQSTARAPAIELGCCASWLRASRGNVVRCAAGSEVALFWSQQTASRFIYCKEQSGMLAARHKTSDPFNCDCDRPLQ
jgi:hypothetical protein